MGAESGDMLLPRPSLPERCTEAQSTRGECRRIEWRGGWGWGRNRSAADLATGGRLPERVAEAARQVQELRAVAGGRLDLVPLHPLVERRDHDPIRPRGDRALEGPLVVRAARPVYREGLAPTRDVRVVVARHRRRDPALRRAVGGVERAHLP